MIQSFSLPQEHETAAGSSSRDLQQHQSSVIFCSRIGGNAQSTRECFHYQDRGGNRDDHNGTCWVGASFLLFDLVLWNHNQLDLHTFASCCLRKSLMTLVQVPLFLLSFGSITPKPFQFVLFIFVCFNKKKTLYIQSFNPSLSCWQYPTLFP